MSSTNETTSLLTAAETTPAEENKVLIPEEFVDDEKGKMNTLEVETVRSMRPRSA